MLPDLQVSPLPLPAAPDVIVIQLARLTAAQGHPPGAVTSTPALPPPDPACWLVGSMANVQPTPCATLNVCPATAIVPVRGPVPPLGATA